MSRLEPLAQKRRRGIPGPAPRTAAGAGRAPAGPSGAPILLGLSLWLLFAVVLGASGHVARLHPPAPQLAIVILTLGLLSVTKTLPALREFLVTLDPRILVALHLTRFVGVYFLVLHERGLLPFAFAVYGGWGDILVASLAAGLLTVVGAPLTPTGRRLYAAWNVLGLVDILGVVGIATRLGLGDPGSMSALLAFPLSLLPTFLVPLIIVSHLWLGVRLARLR